MDQVLALASFNLLLQSIDFLHLLRDQLLRVELVVDGALPLDRGPESGEVALLLRQYFVELVAMRRRSLLLLIPPTVRPVVVVRVDVHAHLVA